ncbi:uncharacterized protein LW94_12081 [Fusarium fujikuroi]|nr:uncharacterized protein LW94_12081 [Fusarium fujikuroi]SCO48138.1 uncharacterized protein FFMR_09047 [Fusarium fujikuroi]SCV36204.1 uncharacterized protein FFB14_05968 [Fusarium fujikuroi]
MYDGLVFNAHNIGFMSSYFSAEKAVNIQPIQILWTTILSTWFPALGEKAHKIAHKALGSPDKKETDAILVKVQYVWGEPSGGFQEHEIFVTECKSWEHDTDEGWTLAADQLKDYLRDNDPHGSWTMFGAVAIGTKVQIYEWRGEKTTTSLTPIYWQLDLGSATDRCTFEKAMERARSGGWDYAQMHKQFTVG